MIDDYTLIADLFGKRRSEARPAESRTSTIVGIATSNSVDGSVRVRIDGDLTGGEDGELTVPTEAHVLEGDVVSISLVGGTAKAPRVTGTVGGGDRTYDYAATAHAAATRAVADAEQAREAAESAATDARSAAQSAEQAATSAESAEASATQAEGSASAAQASASSAQASAGQAATAASDAQASAGQAAASAQDAASEAATAKQRAQEANTAANEAKDSAAAANTAANDALVQVSTVEDVIGTVNWITEHGTYSKTTDTQVDDSKVYYTRTGSGTTSDPYVYTAVAEPTQAGLSSYYELSIDQALSQFVSTHLALTDAGLYVLADANGYKLLITNSSVQVIDTQGHVVTTYGENITFDSSRRQYIGNEDAFILFTPATSSTPASIQIGGGNVTIGGKAPSDLLTSLDISTQQTSTGADITVAGQTVHLANGAKGDTGPQGPAGTSVTISKVEYATSTTESQPSSGWSTTAPSTVAEGSWLWVKTTYSDSTTSVTRAKQGKSGTNGTSVKVSKVEYGTSSTASTTPSSWSTTVPTSIAQGKWLWVKTTYTDNSTATTKSYVGTDGEDGKSVAIKSATKADGVTTVVLEETDGTTTTTKTLTIADGEDGANGTPGTNGKDGASSYVHTAWANSADGATDFSTTVSTNKKYLGVYTDSTQADSTSPSAYSWSLIKGDTGAQGPQGPQGEQGVSVTNVTSTNNTADGGTSVVTVTLSDGTTKTFNVKNGSKGSTGATAQWYYGTALTHASGTATLSTSSTSGVVVGSMYLNTATSKCYKCTAISGSTATWTYAGDLTEGVIDNIEVGGRNLLLNTSSEWSDWVTPTANVSNKTKYWYVTDTSKLLEWATAGTAMSFSFEIEFSGVTASSSGSFHIYSQDCYKSTQNAVIGSSNNTGWNGSGVNTMFGAMSLNEAPADGVYTFTNSSTIAGDGTTYYGIQFSTRADYWASGKYRIRCTKLERGNVATDWTPAPEDAVDEDQLVYIQAASVSSVPTAPTSWVEETGESIAYGTQGDASTITTVWTTKHPTYDRNRPVTFVATQRRTVGGTVTCTQPLPDDTATVIDGGNIITNSIQAHALESNSLKLSNFSDEVTGKFAGYDKAADDVGTLSGNVKSLSNKVATFEAVEQRVASHDGQLETIMNSLKFSEGELELKTQSGSDSTSVALTSTKLAFRSGNSEVASISNEKLDIENAEVHGTLAFGGFAFIPRSNGNLSLKWIGA